MEEFKDLAATLVVSIIGGGVALVCNYVLTRYQETNKFRLAALDRKLEAHQKAFTLWHRLRFSLSDNEKCNIAIQECQSWWIENCLYLPPNVRKEFYFKLMATVPLALVSMERRVEFQDELAKVGKLIESSLDQHVAGMDIRVPDPRK